MTRHTMKLTSLLLILCIFSTSVSCDRKDIHHMMYDTFKNAAMCFRILNGTNQFGCSTSQSGRTGVVHFVNNESDVDWLLQSGTAGPYMAVVPPNLFVRDIMLRLDASPHISGVLLALNITADTRPAHMSPDDTCPNRYSSLRGSCGQTSPWNPLGSGLLLVDWRVPLFVVRDSTVLQQIYSCFEKFNLPLAGQEERPLCSLQMTGHMYAAVDTPTCLRRNSLVNSFSPISYCDPMGDQNILLTHFPRNTYSSAPNGSVVLVTARMDAATMFDGLAPGAVTTVSGIVTLLTTAHLLSQLLPVHKDTYTKNVVFALLNGEAQDYIGSSRVVYDMQQGQLLVTDQPLRLEHLHQVIDVHQLDATRHVHCHCFQSSAAQETIGKLTEAGKAFNVSVEGACSSGQLPPSSLHSFLKANISLPGVILTNHASQYTNMYYNGLLDDTVNVDYRYANGSKVPDGGIQSSLAEISQTLSLTLAQLVDKSISWPANMTTAATATLVDELLHCYLESRQCELFRKVLGGASVGGEGPLPLYVGVSRSPNQVTSLTSLVLVQLTGTPINATEDQCNNPREPSKQSYYTYVWIAGEQPGSGVCLQSGVHLTAAVSPAFSIDNYNWTSGEYSSWTESVWPELSLRMFLRPAFTQELYTLLSGLAVIFLSFVSVYWVNRNSDRLFNPLIAGSSGRQIDSTLLLAELDNPAMYGTCERC